MKRLKLAVGIVSSMVMGICLYSFLLGNRVFHGSFDNEYVAWYLLAKGLFCSVALYLMVMILEKVSNK